MTCIITGSSAAHRGSNRNITIWKPRPGAPSTATAQANASQLLADRFRLTLHRETKELHAYVLSVAKNGLKLHAAKEADASSNQNLSGYVERFHCDLTEFANLLSLRLNMPMTENQDPTVPVRSTGVPPPVLNKTGIEGVFKISVEVKLDGGADTFIAWQRALQDQLGLKLESQKGPLEVLVIDHAEKIAIEI